VKFIPSCSHETKNEDTFAPDACTVRISRERRDPDRDSFLVNCPGGHHEQTSLWAEVKGFYGWRGVRDINVTFGAGSFFVAYFLTYILR
jgi:hypothetical protein